MEKAAEKAVFYQNAGEKRLPGGNYVMMNEKYRLKDREKETDMDKKAFILGMITAFSECVAGGAKKLALSPPLTKEDLEAAGEEAYTIIRKHGLIVYLEENRDLPEAERFNWLVITAKEPVLEAYQKLRRAGFSPARSLAPFYEVLSYDPENAVFTGYDAYKDYFPLT